MMIMIRVVLLTLSFLLFDQIVAVAPRVHQGCTILGSNLYCYGGYQSASGGTFTNATSDHITVDLSTVKNTATPTLQWTTVTTASSTNLLVPRAGIPIIALDNTRYVIVGGGLFNTTLATPAVLYDSGKNAWSALTPPPYYSRDGSMASTDTSTAWFYGGRLNGTMNTVPSNMLQLDLSSLPGTWTSHTGGVGNPSTGRYGHATVSRGQMIYYFGGFFPPASPGGQSVPVPIMNISFYNTVSDQWGRINSNGDVPANRIYHTATLIANSSKILIYGGTGSDLTQALPLLDYCFTHDLNTHENKKFDLDNGTSAGPRMGHSVIQYQQKLYILFGYTSSGYIASDVHVLDVSDPTAPNWAGQQQQQPSTPPSSTPSSSSNTGAIVGGVIGGIAFLAIVVGAVYYWHRKKKNVKPTNEFDLYQPPPPPPDFVTDTSPTLFSSAQTKDSPIIHDAAPSYQHQKPYEHDQQQQQQQQQRGSFELTGLLKIKPSSNE